MTNVKYDISRVPRDLLERFIHSHSILDPHFVATSLVAKDIQAAARVPLRTKAEVDADIVKAVRDYCKDSHCPVSQLVFASQIDEERGHFPYYIEKLLKEETSD